MGLSTGAVLTRVDGPVKAGLLDLVEHAVAAGWTRLRVCRLLDLEEDRAARRATRRAAQGLEGLADARPGGQPIHGLLDCEVEANCGLFEAWGPIDLSHRKLAHRSATDDHVVVASPEDLRYPGWTLRDGPATGATVRGRQVDPARLSGVITRLPAVTANDLSWVLGVDRDYAAAESTAFLTAGLSALTVPVLNLVTGGALCGTSTR